MEIQNYTKPEWRVHPTLGTLHFARDLKDAFESAAQIRATYEPMIKRLPYKLRSQWTLLNLMHEEDFAVYIHVPHVNHDEESDASKRFRMIPVYDDSVPGREVRVRTHDKLRLGSVKGEWKDKDIVLLGVYFPEDVSYFHFTHFLGDHIQDRDSIALRILEQEPPNLLPPNR